MVLYPFFVDILKYTISGLGVVWIAIYLLKPYLDRDERIQLLDFKKNITNQTLPLRLQAYERLVLFIERINPANMLLRLNITTYSAFELHHLIVEEIRNEYQHNVTQQIYVSGAVWSFIKQVKEETLNIVNRSISELPETANGTDLCRAILGHLGRLENSPYDVAASIIRKEIEGIF